MGLFLASIKPAAMAVLFKLKGGCHGCFVLQSRPVVCAVGAAVFKLLALQITRCMRLWLYVCRLSSEQEISNYLLEFKSLAFKIVLAANFNSISHWLSSLSW